jgi:hypothetical protein
VPPNCQRTNIHVVATEDGEAVRSEFVDQERFVNLFTGSGVINIDVWHTAEIGRPHLEDVIVGAARGAAFGAGIGAIGGLGGAVLGGLIGAGRSIVTAVPKQTHTTIARVYGDGTAKLKNLEKIAIKAAFEPILEVESQLGASIAGAWVQISNHRTGKVSECQVRISQGVITAILIGQGPNAVANIDALQRMTPTDQALFGITSLGPITNPVPATLGTVGGIPGASRGTMVTRLVAQVLQSACSLPAAPPAHAVAAQRLLQ